ncbi:MAG: serine hydrolase [Ruminococcus sp.]|jgi:D-alanyl-D-alanine carboxypeptidase (penicillin-binding protein 5/6)|nr:serine hydrolase [Ruminococcus sp.]
MMIIKKTVCFLAAVLLILPQNLPAAAENRAVSEILFELDTGKILYSENADVPMPVGMMSKLLTILAAAREVEAGRLPLDKTVYAPASVADEKGASVWLESGDPITVEELFKSVIIGNANDAALTLAAAAFGSEDKYLEKAAVIARELGLQSTVFTEASGFKDPGAQISSAADMAKILSALSKIDFIAPMFINRLDYVRGEDAQLVNTNKMARSYNGCVGYKYSYSKPSGYCLAAGASQNGNRYGAVLLGYADEDKMYTKAAKMLDAAFEYFTAFVPEPPEDLASEIRVKNGYAESVPVTAGEAGKYVIKKGQAANIEARIILPEYVYAPVKAGQTVGEVHFYLEGEFFCKTKIIAAENVEGVTFDKNLAIIIKSVFDFG